MTEPSHAVFLSYASQDQEAAQRICEALRAVGIEVWFDQSELRGGDAWDRQIREQIHYCRLFMPVVSAHTEARVEGYFRREWKLAVDRTHDLSERVAFLVPVVIDSTSEQTADVPDAFRHVQWTRLPGGETSPAFVARIQKLCMPEAATRAAAPIPSRSTVASASKRSLHPTWPSNILLWVTSALIAIGLTYLIATSLWRSQHSEAIPASERTAASTTPGPSTAAAFNPLPHSIAVLPFVNMSGDKEQEYFSDGLSEELLNSLARMNELQVAARTSSFYFKGKDIDLSTIAHKLNVASVLEGSVRRSGHTIRVTAQLNNAVTGFHIWSQTYDRDLGDVLALQLDIANAVAAALKVALLADSAAKIELGGTRNPAAFDAYVRGSQTFRTYHEGKDLQIAVSAYTYAIQLDPNYALAYVGRSRALDELASWWVDDVAAVEAHANAWADARRAVALTPNLGEAHLVLANSLAEELDFAAASAEHERAFALAPGDALVLWDYGLFSVLMGRTEQGVSASRRAVLLDPLNRAAYLTLMDALINARRPEEAVSAVHDALTLDRTSVDQWLRVDQWVPYYVVGDYQSTRALCESNRQHSESHACLALVYHKLERHADAEVELKKFQAENGDDFQVASTYAQWGDAAKALTFLETAVKTRQGALVYLKTWPLLDPLRKEPRFQAVMRELRFPQ